MRYKPDTCIYEVLKGFVTHVVCMCVCGGGGSELTRAQSCMHE